MKPEDQLSGHEGAVNDALRPKKAKRESNPERWSRLCGEAKEACERAKGLLEELEEMRSEYGDRFDSMNEGLQASAYGQKLQAMQDLDLQSAIDNLDDAASSCEDAEGTEVPLGFGRD